MPRSVILRLALALAALLYFVAWGWHLYANTMILRGFWGDGAMEFLVHLSRSYIFTNETPNASNVWVHLFSVGNPRDGALFLNALGLQAALWLHVTDPSTLKHIFVLWQYALPGLLYIALIFALWRTGRIIWAVFPLLSWAVISVPVDWNAVNNTRWAVPLFWMHVMLCLHAQPHLRWRNEIPALIALVILGALMTAGLYESVVGQLLLLMITGAVIWRREGNNRPFLYALAAVPGALSALSSYLATGQNAANGFHGLVLPDIIDHPYAVFMMTALAALPALVLWPIRYRSVLYILMPVVFMVIGLRLFTTPPLMTWPQVNFRFDYILMAMGLMAFAALCRCADKSFTEQGLIERVREIAPPLVLFTLCAGAVLWDQQVIGSYYWQQCTMHYRSMKGDKPLLISAELVPLIKFNPATMQPYNRGEVSACIWDWTNPWTDLLTARDGRVAQWSLSTFWQYFEFVRKDGAVYLHTNNWTLNNPSVQESDGWLPLKTGLYDLTPLYDKIGPGPLFPRAQCMPATAADPDWQSHLLSLTDDQRRAMFVCPSYRLLPEPIRP